MSDLILTLIQDFLKTCKTSIDALLKRLDNFIGEEPGRASFFIVEENERRQIQWGKGHFFLRASTEYANPQLTLEELQGIIAARLLETCCNYMTDGKKTADIGQSDLGEISEMLRKPPKGLVIPFLLNTDDVEPDRYSINPLRASIVESGQSAFPAASVVTHDLRVDKSFLAKYEGSLISKAEVDLIERHLEDSVQYLDFVDAVKYEILQNASKVLGINLCIPAVRMPLGVLKKEKSRDPMHSLIAYSHRDYDTIRTIYELMGRNIGKRKTLLLTVPHSPKGFGSKRAAQGSLVFKQEKLEQIKILYKTTPLYANELDAHETDVSVAKAEDSFSVEADKIENYEYHQTPSSPQFALYAALSPEDASIWHGIGVFGGVELIKSIVSVRSACLRKEVLEGLSCRGNTAPMQLNLVPEKMWRHPRLGNIDASVGCIQDLRSLVQTGICMEPLFVEERLSS